jgi:hypothetical protein
MSLQSSWDACRNEFSPGSQLYYSQGRLFANIQKNHMDSQFVEIVHTRADHPPCQPTIAAQLLLDGGKIEPYTIIIIGQT